MKSSKLWVASVALLVSVFTTTVSRSDEPTSSDGWTKAQLIECRQWAAYYWAWRDTGQIPPGAEEFNFTFEVGKGFNPLLPTIYLFTQLYAGQLSVDYSILDLINDDPDVYLTFRHHSLTGVVITTFDSPATVRHMNMIALATTDEISMDCDATEYEFPDDGVILDFTGNSLISNILVNKKIHICPNDPGNELPPDDPFATELRHTLNASNLSSISSQGGCTPPDSMWPWGQPGFRCDNFAEALRNYIHHNLAARYPNMKLRYLLLQWPSCGHAMNLVELDGKFYLIDTMTGQVFGPSLTVEHLISQAWKVLKSDEYENTDPLIHWSVESPRPRTLKNCAPWYTDAERRQQIKDCLGITDDSQYLPDDF